MTIQNLQAELKNKDGYVQFANIIRPIVPLAAAAVSFYTLLDNRTEIFNAIKLFCRTVSTNMTFDSLDALLGGYCIEIALVIGTLTAYMSTYLLAPGTLYVALKLLNLIVYELDKNLIFFTKKQHIHTKYSTFINSYIFNEIKIK